MPDSATIRRDLDRLIAGHSATVQAASADLVAGRINAATWEITLRAAIKPVHLAAALAATGGDRQAAQRVASVELRRQYRYLEGFRVDVRSGAQPLDGTLAARATLYLAAARGTYNEAVRAQAGPRGRERRHLGPTEHCDDCLAEAAKGWQPVGTLRRIGDSACIVNCECYFEVEAA